MFISARGGRPGILAAMRAVWVLSLVAACYAPHPPEGAPCNGPDSCPIGQSCVADVCTSHGEPPPDVASQPADAMVVPIDVAPADGALCFGTGLVHVCLTEAPSSPLSIDVPFVVNTDSSVLCQTVPQPMGPDLCVVAVTDANVLAAAIITIIGSRPLVLISSGPVNITGVVDAASHQGAARGAGAQATCAAGLDGGPGNIIGGGGGGGAGGSLGALGADGGNGFQGAPGSAQSNAPPPALIGGCPGGTGGAGTTTTGGLGGNGGAGGGAVYIISSSAITIAGHINASGEGGAFGTFVSPASGGGGGGGAGGMIGLDAPLVAVTGALFANGGGGGGGGGSAAGANGNDGQDASSAGGAVGGGLGGAVGGGNGGTGFSLGGQPGRGSNAAGLFTGGGGGGGGAGIIRVFPAQSVGGTVSPPPT